MSVTPIRKRRLLYLGICIRCTKNPQEYGTAHCGQCLSKFNAKYTPKRNGRGRPLSAARKAA